MNAAVFISICGLLSAAAFAGGYLFGSNGFDERNALKKRNYAALQELLSGQRDLRDRLDALSAQRPIKFSDVVAAQRKGAEKGTKDYPVCPICGKRVDGCKPAILENYYTAIPCGHAVKAGDLTRRNAPEYGSNNVKRWEIPGIGDYDDPEYECEWEKD